MCPPPDRDKLLQDALAAVQAAASRLSPKDKFDGTESAMRAGKLRVQQQRFQLLNEHCDKAVAEIRASLDRAQDLDRGQNEGG
jgi:hypothetical protein